jgi:hypothetical protein
MLARKPPQDKRDTGACSPDFRLSGVRGWVSGFPGYQGGLPHDPDRRGYGGEEAHIAQPKHPQEGRIWYKGGGYCSLSNDGTGAKDRLVFVSPEPELVHLQQRLPRSV